MATMAELVGAILKERGWTQDDLAKRLDTTQVTVSRWLAGTEPRGDKRDAIRALAKESGVLADAPPDERSIVPVMGYIGAGAEIEPEFEQVPTDGFDQVELPFPVPDEMIGLQVRGDSMLPRYDDGDVIVVWREQGRSTASLIGEEAAVRTSDGRRYLKRIMPGQKRGSYTLESSNASPIRDVRIAWASEIFAILPARRVRHLGRKPQRAAPDRRIGRGKR